MPHMWSPVWVRGKTTQVRGRFLKNSIVIYHVKSDECPCVNTNTALHVLSRCSLESQMTSLVVALGNLFTRDIYYIGNGALRQLVLH